MLARTAAFTRSQMPVWTQERALKRTQRWIIAEILGMPAPRGSLTPAPCFTQHTSGLQRLSDMKAYPSLNPVELVVLRMVW